MSYLGLYHVPSSLTCHVYFMLCSIFLMFLYFVWASFSHSSCNHHRSSFTLVHIFFLSLLPLDSFVYSWQKGGKYTREYTEVYRHFYMIHMHILRGRNSTSCTFIGGESHRGDGYTKWEKTSFMRKPCFVCFTLCLFSRCFFVLWVMFSIFALLLSTHRVCVLDMHTFLCYYALLVACSDDHLHCYMIIVFISIWLFGVWSSCSYVSQHIYLIVCLLVILYLSFYHLIYLEGLMCFVQVFQVTGILF